MGNMQIKHFRIHGYNSWEDFLNAFPDFEDTDWKKHNNRISENFWTDPKYEQTRDARDAKINDTWHNMPEDFMSEHTKACKENVRQIWEYFTPQDRIKRCEAIAKGSKRSKMEIDCGLQLRSLNIAYIEQHPVLDLRITDFYLPDYNLILELYGTFWHVDPRRFNENWINPKTKVVSKEMWNYDAQIERRILDQYNLAIIWERDYCAELLIKCLNHFNNLASPKGNLWTSLIPDSRIIGNLESAELPIPKRPERYD